MSRNKLNTSYLYFSILLLTSLLLACLHVITYVDLEQPIYYWDYSNYSNRWQYLSQLQEYSTVDWFKYILYSVRTSDYNASPVAFLFPFYHFPLDNSRTAFILAISICYLTPVILLLTLLFKQIKGYQSYFWLSCIFIFAFTFPVFWGPLLRGYPDIVGLIPILGVILFVLKKNLAEKISIKNVLILGVLLWLPFVLRRWYAYTVVSLYLTLPIFSFFIHTQEDKLCFNKHYRIGVHFLLSGIVFLLLSFLFQKEMLFRIISTDYSNLYSAYQFGHLSSLLETIKFFGLYLFPLFITGLIWSFFSRKSTAKYLGLFSAVNLTLSYILFASTQTPGYHHNLPFGLWFFILTILGIKYIISLIISIKIRKIILAGSALFSIVVFSFTFYDFDDKSEALSDRLGEFTSFSNYILPMKNYPLRIENFANYQSLSVDIEQWFSDGKKVTLIASSPIFNESTISSIIQANNDNYLTDLHQSHIHVDLRDKLGLERFLTDYVVVGSPVQTHLPSGQNVITIPAETLLSGTSIGAAYRRLDNEYELAQGVKAIVFEKIRPFTQQEIQGFLGKFIAIYPDWEDIYLNPLTLSYMTSSILLGDGPQSVFSFYVDGQVIYAYPGITKPIHVKWDFADMQALIVALPNASCGITDGVLIQLANEEGLHKDIEVAVMTEIAINVTEFAHTKGTLTIDNNGNDACDQVLISAK